jgi:hypothetical protein
MTKAAGKPNLPLTFSVSPRPVAVSPFFRREVMLNELTT